MILSNRANFIFLKTVKTASTSVEVFLEKYCYPEGEWKFKHGTDEYVSETGIVGFRGNKKPLDNVFYNHMPAYLAKEKIEDIFPGKWDKFTKITTIRNPFDKAISLFYMKKNECRDLSADERVLEFKNFMKKPKIGLYDRYIYFIDDEPCVDYFIRYEHLHSDILDISSKLGLDLNPDEIPKLKSGVRKSDIPIKDYFDEQTEECIRNYFHWEIDRFNYSL